MDKVLKGITNLNDYAVVTREFALNRDVHLNLATVLALKKIQSFEIQFFQKFEETGIAIAVFNDFLSAPRSKTWSLLGKDLITILRSWLDASRKLLFNNTNINWWMFLKILLQFLKNVRQKHNSLPNLLVEETAELLLDIATHSKVDLLQKYEIVYCFNLFCAETGREIRVIMKTKLEKHLLKLSKTMSSCGHFPTQLGILEALLRWTIGRQELAVRKGAVKAWLPSDVFHRKAVELFLERNWNDFSQDARDFLNALNSESSVVTSVVCKLLVIGNVYTVVSGLEKKEVWIDLNSSTSCITMQMDPRNFPKLFLNIESCYEILIIKESDVEMVKLLRSSPEDANIIINVIKPIEIGQSKLKIANGQDIMTITVRLQENFDRVNVALREMFGDAKYKLLHSNSYLQTNNEFSRPPELRSGRRSGYVVKTRYDPLRSPSTTSTTSLAQLPQKLAALPRYRYNKEPVSVCAQPQLSNVDELTEPEDRSSANTTADTFKLRRCAVATKSYRNKAIDHERRSQSDSELRKTDKSIGINISPATHDDNSVSLLLVATIGSDDSVINDTIARLPKEKSCTTDNIIEMLAQEALQAKTKNKTGYDDSGIITGGKTTENDEINSDVVENTPYFVTNPKPCTTVTIRSKDKYTIEKKTSSSNESNTEETNDDPEMPINYVSTRSKKPPRFDNEESVFDCQIVDNFFSQHVSENPAGELIISPTLAKQINSSNNSVDFDELQIHENNQLPFVEEDVFNCLNNLIDKVCDDLQNIANLHLTNDQNKNVMIGKEKKIEIIKKVKVLNDSIVKNKTVKSKQPAKKQVIKLKYPVISKTERTTKMSAKNKITKPKLVTETKMSTITEADDEVIESETSPRPVSPAKENPDLPSDKTSTDSDTALIRRKRKLYSPKQDDADIGEEVKKPKIIIPETCENLNTVVSNSKSTKNEIRESIATPYKDIEKERKRIRKPRNKKYNLAPLSPKSVKINEMFDRLKDRIENNENIKLIDKDKEGIYNFTSESEDEDFKKKKNEIHKRLSTTTITSVNSAKSTKKGRKVAKVTQTEITSDSTKEDNRVQKPRPRRSKRKNSKTKKILDSTIIKDLVDEKIRATPNIINTSLIENPNDFNLVTEPEPIIEVNPEIEINEVSNIDLGNKKKTQKNLSMKKEFGTKSNKYKKTIPISSDSNVSPLPGLVVETVPQTIDVLDGDRSISPNLMKKLKKMYKDGKNSDYNITNTTQNLLSDMDIINCSPDLNITEEVNEAIPDVIEIDDFTNFTADSNKENTPWIKTKRIKISSREKHRVQSNINTQMEAINLDGEDVDEKSIDTNGRSPITAHGDSNENPPNPELLNKAVIPRNLEVEALDESTAKYFLKLTKEANESGDNLYSCDERTSFITNKKHTSDNSTNKTPLIRIPRLSSSDVHKWLPSPRSSDSEDGVTLSDLRKSQERALKENMNTAERKNKINAKNQHYKCTVKKDRRSKKPKQDHVEATEIKIGNSNTSPTNKSPVICLSRMSSGDIQKWLPSPRTCDSYDNTTLSDASKSCKAVTKERDHKNIKDAKYCNIFEQNETETEKSISKNVSTSDTKQQDEPIEFLKQNITSPIIQTSQTRKTMISPINLSFDFTPCVQLSSSKSMVENKQSTPKQRSDSKTSNNDKPITPKRSSRHPKLRESPESVRSTVKEVPDKVSKRRYFDDEDILYGPSITSVDQWFERIRNTPDDSGTSQYNELIDTVVEKLDSTLVQIHHSTSKKFIGLFVNTQQQLQLQALERRTMYKERFEELKANMNKMIDVMIEDLEKSTLEMEQKFMQNIKKQACNLVREDNKQKNAMVALLKEDLQAFGDHITKQKRTE